MWQSHVEIKGYYVAYFDPLPSKRHIAELPVRAGAHMRFVDLLGIH